MHHEVQADPTKLMVVVNLADFHFEFQDHSIYTCPAEADGFKSSYKHYPAFYAGIYINKGARFVTEVEAVVHLSTPTEATVLWKFTGQADEEVIKGAISRRSKAVFPRTGRLLNNPPCLIFLFGKKRRTDFEYDIRGGLQGSRQYFDLSSLSFEDLDGLAAELRQTTWSALPKRNG